MYSFDKDQMYNIKAPTPSILKQVIVIIKLSFQMSKNISNALKKNIWWGLSYLLLCVCVIISIVFWHYTFLEYVGKLAYTKFTNYESTIITMILN